MSEIVEIKVPMVEIAGYDLAERIVASESEYPYERRGYGDTGSIQIYRNKKNPAEFFIPGIYHRSSKDHHHYIPLSVDRKGMLHAHVKRKYGREIKEEISDLASKLSSYYEEPIIAEGKLKEIDVKFGEIKQC